MGEKIPEKKEESNLLKKNVFTFSIDLDELVKRSEFVLPQNQDTWHKAEDMSPEYNEMMNCLSILALYLAKSCNEGPEVKDNCTKQIITVKTILEIFLTNLSITGYMAYGLLTELLLDSYMKISGKQQTISLLKHIQKNAAKKAVEKSIKYIT